MLAFPPTLLRDVEPGSHVALVFDDTDQQIDACVPFLYAGLEQRECCAYFAEPQIAARAMDRLTALGVDVQAEQRRGALALVTEAPDGLRSDGFEPGSMITFLRQAIDGAFSAGFTGFRAAGDATLAMGPDPDLGRATEYEALLDDAFSRLRGARGVCGYDRRRVPPEIIGDMLRTHPLVVVGDQLCASNLYYEPPTAVLGARSETERVEWMLTQLTRLRAAEEERSHLHEDLAERERQLAALVNRLFDAQEEERRRMAYEIHDGFAQVAASAQQHLEEFAARCPTCPVDDRRELDRALELARRAVGESRRIITGLRPITLDDLGLAAAIRLEADELRAAGFQATYTEALGAKRVSPAVETALFRIAQEALTNFRKHARSPRVAVRLAHEGTAIRLQVRDWGAGFNVGAQEPGGTRARFGLASMRERATLLGGQLAVRSRPGAGTTVIASIPLVPRTRAENGPQA